MCDMNAVETHVRTLVLADGSGGDGGNAVSGILGFTGSLSATSLMLVGFLLFAGGLAAGLFLRTRREAEPSVSGNLATSE